MRRLNAVIIRRLSLNDIDAAARLIQPQNWNQSAQDWERFLALEPEGCFAALRGTDLVGTATTELFHAVGWIGMLIVESSLRGQGIGRALMAAAIAYLRRKGARTIKLDATPSGKPLYDKLGFRQQYPLFRMLGLGQSLPSAGVRPVTGDPGDLRALLSLDRKANRTDRRAMVLALMRGWPELAAVHETNGIIDGYIAGRHGLHYEHLGPLVATSREAAAQLLRWGLSAAVGKQVILDRPATNESALLLGRQYGFRPLRSFTRMHLGNEPFLDRPELIYATSGAEKG